MARTSTSKKTSLIEFKGTTLPVVSVTLQDVYKRQHFDFAGPACTNDFESDHRFAVEQGGRTLLGDGVADRCQLAETNPATIGQRDFHGADFFGGIHSANGPQCLLGAADIGARCV